MRNPESDQQPDESVSSFRTPHSAIRTRIELLIIVAVMLVLVALAVPALLQSRVAANEAAAIATMRAVLKAEAAYALAFHSGYSADLYSLGPTDGKPPSTSRAGLVDASIAGASPRTSSFSRDGYGFTYAPGGTSSGIRTFELRAVPLISGATGRRGFYADHSMVIRASATGSAGPADAPVREQ